MTSDRFEALETIDDASCACDGGMVDNFVADDGAFEEDLNEGDFPAVTDDTEPALRTKP